MTTANEGTIKHTGAKRYVISAIDTIGNAQYLANGLAQICLACGNTQAEIQPSIWGVLGALLDGLQDDLAMTERDLNSALGTFGAKGEMH